MSIINFFLEHNNYSQSMNHLDSGSRAAEISRGNEPKPRSNRYSLDNLDDYPESTYEPGKLSIFLFFDLISVQGIVMIKGLLQKKKRLY